MASNNVIKMDGFDVVIVGGGPCGCVLAKDLSKAGKKVILIEKGGNNLKGIGSMMGMLNGEHMERAKMGIWASTIEGQNVVMGTGIGGGSYLYAGIAGMPLFSAFDTIGIDLRPYLAEAKKETWVHETPDEFMGPTTKMILDATNSKGIPLVRTSRHIDFNKCQYGCTSAAFGCKKGGKWMGFYAANEAQELGAKLQTYTTVKRIIVENGVAKGVYAKNVKDGQEYEIRGKIVVCSAGGPGSALVLMHSGIEKAGTRCFGDPAFGSWGLLPENSKYKSHYYEHGTSVAWFDDTNGCLFYTNVSWSREFWTMYHVLGGINKAIDIYKYFPRMISISNKIHDEGVGKITWDGRVSKTMTIHDEEKLNYSRHINEKILLASGCESDSIHHSGFSHIKGDLTFGHPGGTCPVGVVVDTNLETEIKNCFVCDISSLPGAPSRPPVLTLVTLTKWFAPRLIAKLEGKAMDEIVSPDGHEKEVITV